MPIRAPALPLVPLVGLFVVSLAPAASAQSVEDSRLIELAQRGENAERGRPNDEDGDANEGRRSRDDRRGEPRAERGGRDRDEGKGDRRQGGRDAKQAREPRPQRGQEAREERRSRPAPAAAEPREPRRASPEPAQKTRETDQRDAKQRQDEPRKRSDDDAKRRDARQTDEREPRQRGERQRQDRDGERKRQARPEPRDGGGQPPPADARRKSDQETDRGRRQARERERAPDRKSAARPADNDRELRRFEDVRKKRTERTEGGRNVIVEPDNRKIVRQKNRTIIRHDDNRRLRKSGREVRRERQKDGTWLIVTAGLAGALIYSLQDDDGRLLRRSRRDKGGREYVLFDNRRHYYEGRGASRRYDPYFDSYIDLPPPRLSISRDEYIVEYDGASEDDIYDALLAPPVEKLDRRYSLDEVRYSYNLLERMRRVDLNVVNFDFGSWEVTPDQYPKLERVADALDRILEDSPDEVFLLEGHTDAVGSDVDNLSLSDRRAESVAIVLTEEFDIPPENLMTQGYGEYHLKVNTQEPSRINRRVALRRITPLLDREGWSDDVSGR